MAGRPHAIGLAAPEAARLGLSQNVLPASLTPSVIVSATLGLGMY